ncbi:MAG: response regulator transcription factor [Anaerolineales bacterium]|nr:response regulator transcription factor [Anaerolineales bacterium]
MKEIILVVDDEPKITRLAQDYLEKSGFTVLTSGDGQQALTITRQEKPDLIVLDLMLPGMDGLDVCRAIRRESDVPIIMLTARAEEADQLIGLELGADDYITKPFSPRALVARVRALLRRTQGNLLQEELIRLGDLELDLRRQQLSLKGEFIHLTRSDFLLLEILAKHPGQPLSREQLLEKLHDVVYDGVDRSVDSHIKNLRRKIEPDPSRPAYIQTVYGFGYKIQGDPS